MKSRLILTPVIVAVLAGMAGAATLPRQPAVSAKSVRDDAFPQTQASYPGGIVARPHVEFANYVGYRPLQLDLYLHSDRAKAKPRPLVVWVHGGGWSRGDSRQSSAFTDFPAVLAMLAARGYVVASVDYRLSGEAPFPAQIQDVKAAIRFLRSKAADYGIDGSRVLLWGGSAGGHLAALGATSCGVPALDPVASTGRLPHSQAVTAKPLPQSDCVQGAAIWYKIFDLANRGAEPGTAIGENTMATLLGCKAGACGEAEKAASPIAYIKGDTPPMLLIHGTADDEVSWHQTEGMTAALKRAGVPVDTLLIPGSNHGFIGKTAEDTRRFSLQALDRTFAFFDRVARP